MKKHIVITLCMLIFLSVDLYSQDIEWATRFGDTETDQGNKIAIDSYGNIYTTGTFLGTVDFDPGTNVFNLSSTGSNENSFICKLDDMGNFIWAKNLGSNLQVYCRATTIDALGNVYITGSFWGTVDFNPGAENFNMTVQNNSSDTFISKLDASGNFVWAKQFKGKSNNEAYAITVDAQGNIYTTGFFGGTVDFDPGSNVFVLISDQYKPYNEGNCQENVFVSKLDASGNFIWAKQLKGHYSIHERFINVDTEGNIYTSGHFQSLYCSYEYTSGESNVSKGPTYFYLFKLDASGNVLSEKQLSISNNFMDPDRVSHAYADVDGNIYLIVNFRKELFYTSDTETITVNNANYFEDSVIFKINPLGELLWFKQFKGDGAQHINSITTDISGNIYTTGYFTEISDFDSGTEIFTLNSSGGNDIFISKLDSSGNFVGAKQLGSTSDDSGNSITVDIYDNVYTCGTFQETVDFNTGVNTNYQTSSGKSDIFIHKLEQKTLSTEINQSNITETIYPNPSNGLFNVSFFMNKNTPYIITDITGKFITKGTLINSTTTVNLSEITNGIYLFITKEKTIRLIKQ